MVGALRPTISVIFLRNAWYPAAWEREIGANPYAATVLAEKVAIYRKADGGYAALADGCVHRKQQYEVRYPSLALIKAYFSPAGTGGEGKPLHPQTFIMDSYNFLTPVDESTTRYFWFQQRNVAPNDEDVSLRFAASVRSAFEEDKRILAAVQRGMDAVELGATRLNLRSDTGGVRFRRRLSHLIAAEQA